MPRKTKYTPEAVARILQAIQLGATYELAAQYGGISPDTLTRWQVQYTAFADSIKEAEGKSVVASLAKINKAASDGAWQAAAWLLERRYPHAYGKTVSISITGIVERIAAEMDVPVFDVLEEADRLLVSTQEQR